MKFLFSQLLVCGVLAATSSLAQTAASGGAAGGRLAAGFGPPTEPYSSSAAGGVGGMAADFYPGGAGPLAHGESARVVYFSAPDPKAIDAWQEDLSIMSLLLERQLERVLGQKSPQYRMGIPMLLKPGNRGVHSIYIEGLGAMFFLSVNFPLVEPPAKDAKEPAPEDSDWDAIRRELYGARTDQPVVTEPGGDSLPAFNAEQVELLKTGLLEALKQGSKIRHLKPDETIAVVVSGSESISVLADSGGGTPGQGYSNAMRMRYGLVPTGPPAASNRSLQRAHYSGRNTVLTLRVRKADVVAFGKGELDLETLRQKAAIQTYLSTQSQRGAFYYRSER